MTALKPTSTRRVQGVSSERYPLNRKSSHPESNEKVDDPHHIFPRSSYGGDSWFVTLEFDDAESAIDVLGDVFNAKADAETGRWISEPIPHVTGLSREEHERVERHDAWIKLEDGVFVWYELALDTERTQLDGHTNASWASTPEAWIKIGPLNPQPGSREGKPKRRKHAGEKARNREVVPIRIPVDERENGAEILAGLLDQVRERLHEELGYDEKCPWYYTLVPALHDWLGS